VNADHVTLRPYIAADEEAAIKLWWRTWQAAYPSIDFGERVAWWRERWCKELVPNTTIVMAEKGRALVGFITVDQAGYLDQFVVAPEEWGAEPAAALLAEAKRIAPAGLDLHVNQDNGRAVRFYEKHGFVIAGSDKNPISGRPTFKMSWRT
jgi:putative acetyltransferase